MHDDDLRDSDAGSDSLPLPGWVATGRGYTREVALESVGAGWAALIHFLFDRIERRRFVFPYHSGRQASASTPSSSPGAGQGTSRAFQLRPASSDLKTPWLLAA